MGGLPWGIECNRLCVNATTFTGAIDALGFLVASGRADVGIIGAAQIDKYGNVNTTGIWDDTPLESGALQPPRIRFNGSGGANDIAVGCKRFLIMAAHEKKRFSERVDYISSPGYLTGDDSREKCNFPGAALRDHHDPGHPETGSGHQGVLSGRLLPFLHRRGDQGEHRVGSEDFTEGEDGTGTDGT